MFEKLSRLLSKPRSERSEAQCRQLAMAVLLVETARADFQDQDAEHLAMREALVRSLGLGADEAQALIERAFTQARESVSLHGFLATLNAELDAAGKRDLLEALWRVAYADGRLDPQEEARIRQLADLLFVPHADFVQLRLKVAAEAIASS